MTIQHTHTWSSIYLMASNLVSKIIELLSRREENGVLYPLHGTWTAKTYLPQNNRTEEFRLFKKTTGQEKVVLEIIHFIHENLRICPILRSRIQLLLQDWIFCLSEACKYLRERFLQCNFCYLFCVFAGLECCIKSYFM